MLNAMISHTESCVMARASVSSETGGINSNLNMPGQQVEAEGNGTQPRAAKGENGDETEGIDDVTPVTTQTRGDVTAVPEPGRHRGTTADTGISPTIADDRRATAQREFDRLDADKREYNIIVHGVPETDQTGDEEAIYEMLSYLHCANRLHQIENAYRLGRKQYRNTRMLLIKFNNKAAVREVLEKGPRLTRSGVFGNIFVRRDLPVSQRQRPGRNNHALAEAAQGPRVEPRVLSSPRTNVERSGASHDSSAATETPRVAGPSTERLRLRRVSVQSRVAIIKGPSLK